MGKLKAVIQDKSIALKRVLLPVHAILMQTFISIMRKEALIADEMNPTDQESRGRRAHFLKSDLITSILPHIKMVLKWLSQERL
jgi:hypothetical protein